MSYIHIKNMVCRRCINSVRDTLIAMDIPYNTIQLGEVELVETLSKKNKNSFFKAVTIVMF